MSPTTTFTLQTLDGGVNPQTRAQAGIEAVCFRPSFVRPGSKSNRITLQSGSRHSGMCVDIFPILEPLNCLRSLKYTIGLATKVPVTFISVGENNSDGVDGFMCVFFHLHPTRENTQ
jgi:tripeptidyl-peptidase-1